VGAPGTVAPGLSRRSIKGVYHIDPHDVAERTRNEEEASVSLQQFEAAAGFGGLGLSVGKTEATGCRIKKAVISEEVENAIKVRTSVKVDELEMCGWIAPAK